MSDAVVLKTEVALLRRVRQVNYATNGYPTRAQTLTKPTITDPETATGQVAFEATGGAGGQGPNGILLHPFGIGNDDTTFSLRVLKWALTLDSIGSARFQPVWKPIPLIEVQCTLSTDVGVASGYVLNTERSADTITLTGTTANPAVNCDINSPANNTAGSVYVDLKGALLWEVIFTTGGSATSCNALYQLY